MTGIFGTARGISGSKAHAALGRTMACRAKDAPLAIPVSPVIVRYMGKGIEPPLTAEVAHEE